MKKAISTALLCLALLGACKEDPEQSANKLLVESIPLWTQYQALPPTDPAQLDARAKLLADLKANLDKIVHDYPESSLAVDLAANGNARNISRAEINNAISEVSDQIKCRDEGAKCIMPVITKALETIKATARPADLPHALGAIAGALASAGDIDGAKATIEEAKAALAATSQQITDNWVLQAIGEAQAKAGDVTEALTTLGLISDPSARAWTLRYIILAQIKSGDVNAIKTEVASELSAPSPSGPQDEQTQVQALAVLSEAIAVSGDSESAIAIIERALKLANGPGDYPNNPDGTSPVDSTKAMSFALIAGAQGVIGVQSEAQASITKSLKFLSKLKDNLKDNSGQANVMAVIATGYVKMGKLKEAQDILKSALESDEPDTSFNDFTKQSIVGAQSALGDLEGALETLASIESALLIAWSLNAISEELAKQQ